MISGEVLVGIAGLLVSAATYFAGIRHAERRRGRDDVESRISRVVDEYQRLFEPRRDSGISALLKAGVLLLCDETEVQEVVHRLELRNGLSPLRPHVEALRGIPLLPILHALRAHKIDPKQHDCILRARSTIVQPPTAT